MTAKSLDLTVDAESKKSDGGVVMPVDNKSRFYQLMRDAGATLVSTDPYERWKITVTPDVADALLAISDPFQRALSDTTARYYARIQARGEWMPYVDPLMVTSEHYTTLDGQHRLSAVKRSGIPQKFEIVIRPRATIVALDQRKARGISDTDSAIRQRAPLNNRVQAAVEIAMWGTGPIIHVSRLERGKARDAFSTEALEFAAEVSTKRTVRLPSPVLAVAIQAFEKHPAEARQFFLAMAQNSAVVMGREWAVLRYMCAKILGLGPVGPVSGEIRKRAAAGGQGTRRELYVRVAHAWNAFISGNDITHTKYSPNIGDPEIM